MIIAIATRLAAIDTKFHEIPSRVMASVPKPSTAIPSPRRGSHGATRARSRLATRHRTLPPTKVTTPSQSSTGDGGARHTGAAPGGAACSVAAGTTCRRRTRTQHAPRQREERRSECGRDAEQRPEGKPVHARQRDTPRNGKNPDRCTNHQSDQRETTQPFHVGKGGVLRRRP